MECENVRVVINQEYEFSGTCIYHDGRFFLGKIHDISVSKKAQLAARTVFKDDADISLKIVSKIAVKAIAKAAISYFTGPSITLSYGFTKVLPVGDDVDYLKESYQDHVTDEMYKKADTFWELDLPSIISISLWGSIVKIEFDDDNYGYSACNLHFPSQEIAEEWEKMLNSNRRSLALPESTE